MSTELDSLDDSVVESSGVVADEAIALAVLADDRESNQWKWQHPGIGWAVLWTLLLVVAQLGLGIVFGVLVVVTGRNIEELPLLLVGSLTNSLTALFVSCLLFGKQMRDRMGLRGFTVTQGLIVFGLVLPIAVMSSEIANVALEFLPVWGLDLLSGMHGEGWPTLFVGACILPAFGEELYFRGFLSRGLIARRGWWVGSFVASALFALIHMIPIQVCATFGIGLVLQFVYVMTRSLPAAMLLHFFNNLLAFATMKLAGLFEVPGLNMETADVVTHTPPSVLIFAALTATGLLRLLYDARTRWLLPDRTEWRSESADLDIPAPHLQAQQIGQSPNGFLVALTLSCYGGLLAAIIHATSLV